MKSVWFRNGKNQEDRERIKGMVLGSKKTLDILAEICYNIIKNDSEVSKQDYQSAGWAFEQAHRNGRQDALREIISIINLTET